MEDEVYTVEDIFERDTPLTEDLLDNSDGLTLSPITMLRRYMAEKELQKQKEKAEEEAEEMETDLMESIGYMNGGGIGSMMQPKQNFLNGGRVGLFMGGSPLDGEALAIYNSMNAYGYDDQTIADKLLALNLYTPIGTTPPPGTTPPGTPPGGGNSGGGGDGGAGPAIITKKTRDKNIDLGIAAANADKGNLTLEEITAMNDLSGQESMRGQITPKTTLSDPYAYSRGPQAVNASGDINKSKSLSESLFPEGNLQEIIANSKTQKDYNINATKDLVENLPGGILKDIAAPALAGVMSPFYDGIQGIYRGITDPNKSVFQALKDENIGSSMIERFTGAAAPLAERLSSLPSSAALAAALGSTNAPSVLDQLISSNEITDRNRGMEDNENFIDRGNPNNDLRVASEEMGLVGGIPDRNRGQISPSTIQEVASALGRPNMADIANTVSKDNSISVEDFTSPSKIGDFAVTAAEALANQTGMIDGPPSIGFAKDPEGVEDPFGGKYTPSFEKEDLNGLAGLIDGLKGYNFKDALTPKSIATGLFGGKLAGLIDIPTAIGSFGANQFRKKLEANRTEKAMAASKNRTETRALQAKIDTAEKKRQDDITKTDNANAKAAAAGKAYDYSGRSNKQGTHTSTVSKQKAADNRESGRGQTTSSKGSSKSNSSSKGSTSSGAGGGGGASRGRSSGRNSSQSGGGFNSYGFSDIRLKDNIELVGKSPSNINIYNFTYLKDSKVYQGVMAHEVPWASVKHDSGYLMVDYNKVDVDFKIVH
jgi:hypothetical protein